MHIVESATVVLLINCCQSDLGFW